MIGLTHENILQIVKALKADATLVAMLAENPPYYDVRIRNMSRVNSIVPAEFMGDVKNMPSLGVKAGVTTLRGTNYIDAFILIRCYNNMDKAYVDINTVLSRVEAVINDKLFTLTGMVNIATTLESISAESVDDAYSLRYREAQFRLQLI